MLDVFWGRSTRSIQNFASREWIVSFGPSWTEKIRQRRKTMFRILTKPWTKLRAYFHGFVIIICSSNLHSSDMRIAEEERKGTEGEGYTTNFAQDIPAAPMTCSPLSWSETSTKGSARFSKRSPSSNWGIWVGFTGSIATLTIAEA